MATKVIVRYKQPNPLIGRRELFPRDFESLGIFTQKKPLIFDKSGNFWLDAEKEGISKEAMDWLRESPEFTVEEQEVPDDADTDQVRFDEARAASLAAAPQPDVLTGESASETDTKSAKSTTTRSTAKPTA